MLSGAIDHGHQAECRGCIASRNHFWKLWCCDSQDTHHQLRL